MSGVGSKALISHPRFLMGKKDSTKKENIKDITSESWFKFQRAISAYFNVLLCLFSLVLQLLLSLFYCVYFPATHFPQLITPPPPPIPHYYGISRDRFKREPFCSHSDSFSASLAVDVNISFEQGTTLDPISSVREASC